MPTLIHQRVRLCNLGTNATAIAKLPGGWLVLGDNQTLPGYCLLLSDPTVVDLNTLPPADRAKFLQSMALAGDALLEATGAYLINYSILGNTDHALHAHIHPRYRSEPEDKRRTGYWAYFPPHPQIAFDPLAHGPLIVGIRTALLHHAARHRIQVLIPE